ncbi:MAG: hypothetical protein H6865_05005 [Rhodospirillales bacterium]|nr:hypothetical protein [Alphaproteobacteria bacterium]MCB9986976.1 hypothetical protein [Rhodospirillales bacterium]USO08250.1 MAG: hypothetical protein H6866_03285 [Rhodospirillales bacterium]
MNMMMELGIVLGASLMLFVSAILWAVLADWLGSRDFYKMLADTAAPAPHRVQRNFHQAARRPARVLGSFIL